MSAKIDIQALWMIMALMPFDKLDVSCLLVPQLRSVENSRKTRTINNRILL